MAEPYESISLYRKGQALTGKGDAPHVDKEYTIFKDQTVEGVRTIVLQEKDLAPFREKARKLAEVMAEMIGEGESKVVKELLLDVLKDYEEKKLDELYKRVVERGEPVKAQEGCYKLIVGDGRTRKSEHIMLRE